MKTSALAMSLLLFGVMSHAGTTINTVGDLSRTYIDDNYARASGTYTWGQTFATTTTDSYLSTFTAYFNSFIPDPSTSASIYKWDSVAGNPTGPELWRSSQTILSVDQLQYFVDASVTFKPEVLLSKSTTYLLVFNHNFGANGLINRASTYVDGDAFIRPDSSPYNWAYSILDYADMPLVMNLSPQSPIPELPTGLLLSSGIVLAVLNRKSVSVAIIARGA